MVQYRSLFQASSYFAALNPFPFLLSFPQSVLPRLSMLHCPFSQELLKVLVPSLVPSHGAISVSGFPQSFFHPLVRCVPVFFSPGKVSAPSRSLHIVLNLLLRECKERVSLRTGSRLDEFSKWATNNPIIID